jgi:hypothetical protein
VARVGRLEQQALDLPTRTYASRYLPVRVCDALITRMVYVVPLLCAPMWLSRCVRTQTTHKVWTSTPLQWSCGRF